MNEAKPLTPMPLGETLLIFAFTAISGPITFYWLRPALENAGLPEMMAYLISISIVLALMLVVSLAAFWRERGEFNWRALIKRFRLERPDRGTVLWAVGLSIFMLGAEAVFSPILAQWIESGLIRIPAGIPAYLDPTAHQALNEIKAQFVREGVFWIIPVVLFFNIVGEEFLWRGFALPRQELAHGKNTWLLHGLLWGFSHTFQYWLLPPILLGTLALSYLAQKRKSTWVGLIAHAINNSLPILVIAFM